MHQKRNEEIVPPREKAYFHAKLPVHRYFFNQPLHCNDVGMACIIINDDVSFTRCTRVNKRIILSRRTTSFHAQFNGLLVLS